MAIYDDLYKSRYLIEETEKNNNLRKHQKTMNNYFYVYMFLWQC